jgi:hypothetical protein
LKNAEVWVIRFKRHRFALPRRPFLDIFSILWKRGYTAYFAATGINDIGSKFAIGVNDTGGKLWEQYQTADTLK